MKDHFIRRRIIIIGIIAIFYVSVIMLSISASVEKDGKRIIIQNFDEYFSNMNGRDRGNLENALYGTLHNEHGVKEELTDVFVRNGAFEQKFNNGIYTALFIVDSESLKESYFISYSWSYTEEVLNPYIAHCPSQNDIIYESSVCYQKEKEITGLISWKYYYQIEYSIGKQAAAYVKARIEEAIKDNSDISSMQTGHEAIVDETSLKKLDNFVYTANFVFDEQSNYSVIVKTDESFGSKFIVVIINSERDQKTYVYVCTADGEPNKELELWSKQYQKFDKVEFYTKER